MKKQQTIFITGASSGIGKAATVKLAKDGHKVFAGIRRKADKAEIESLDKNITGVYMDVTNLASIEKALWFIIKNTDKLDVLINNAGIVTAGPVELLKPESIEEQFKVNTIGPILVTQKFLPMLIGGKIINMSSVSSTGLFPYISAYCASKRALDIFFNCFALENKDNIKVISIKPASVKTPIWNRSTEKAKAEFENINEVEKSKYGKELLYLEKNALEHNFKGLETEKVVNTIRRVIKSDNPKPSYTVGFQSKLAVLAAKILPETWLNQLIKIKLSKIS